MWLRRKIEEPREVFHEVQQGNPSYAQGPCPSKPFEGFVAKDQVVTVGIPLRGLLHECKDVVPSTRSKSTHMNENPNRSKLPQPPRTGIPGTYPWERFFQRDRQRGRITQKDPGIVKISIPSKFTFTTCSILLGIVTHYPRADPPSVVTQYPPGWCFAMSSVVNLSVSAPCSSTCSTR